VFLDLFGLFFLLIKLAILPLAKPFQRRFFSNKDWSVKNNKEEVQLVRFIKSPVDEASQKFQAMKNYPGNNSEVVVQTIFETNYSHYGTEKRNK
jgi:hypothetical protein